MNVFACCIHPARVAVQKATGVEPLCCPPVTAESFDPLWLEGHDLLYFRLHGFQDRHDVWYGEHPDMKKTVPAALWAASIQHYPALAAKTVERADVSGSIVVIANCYGADNPVFAGAFYTSGAIAVIAAPGTNFAAGSDVIGADSLVKTLIDNLQRGMDTRKALAWAKTNLLFTAWRAADRDALGFRIVEV